MDRNLYQLTGFNSLDCVISCAKKQKIFMCNVCWRIWEDKINGKEEKQMLLPRVFLCLFLTLTCCETLVCFWRHKSKFCCQNLTIFFLHCVHTFEPSLYELVTVRPSINLITPKFDFIFISFFFSIPSPGSRRKPRPAVSPPSSFQVPSTCFSRAWLGRQKPHPNAFSSFRISAPPRCFLEQLSWPT